MFRPEKIQKATVYFPRESKEKLFTQLHESGVCEIAEETAKPSPELTQAVELLQYVHRLQNRFSPYKPKKLIPAKITSKLSFERITKDIGKVDLDTQDLLEVIHESELEKDKLIHIIQTLRLLPQDVPTDKYVGGKLSSVEVGTMPTEDVSKLGDIVYSAKSIADDQSLIIAMGETGLDQQLFKFGFIRLDFEKTNKTPAQLIEAANKQLEKLAKTITEAKAKLQTIAVDFLPTLEVYEEEVDITVRELTGVNQTTYFASFASFVCWVTQSNQKQFEKVLSKQAPSAVYVYETKDEDAPSQLENKSPLIRPFELITKLYSVPKSRGFDPTFFIAFTFPLFYGLMLTDFAYGVTMLLFASAIFAKTPKREVATRNFSALLIISGVCTMVFGAIFGSYFGNFFQALGFNVPLLLDSMKDIIPMIAIVLTLGIIHISIGLIVGFIENTKAKNHFSAWKDQGVWIVFVISVLLLLVSGLAGVPVLNTIGLSVLGLSVLLQFVLSFKKDGPINAVLSLFDFSGFMGDVFSYIRLMALAIGTSGIALAVNFMVLMAADMPYVGVIFAILIFIVGHLFNLVMNGLGGFIHTLRLHFLEHFSKYYDGGGKEYTPYFANRSKTLNEVKKND